MARRKLRPRPPADQRAMPPRDLEAKRLPRGADAVRTALVHKDKAVLWHDGILYCEGKAIGRRPSP